LKAASAANPHDPGIRLNLKEAERRRKEER
jgi:hypothetical protein